MIESASPSSIYAVLGIAPPAYTGGNLEPAPSSPETADAQLDILRRAGAGSVRRQLAEMPPPDILRLSTEIEATIDRLAAELEEAPKPLHGPKPIRKLGEGGMDGVRDSRLIMLESQIEHLQALSAFVDAVKAERRLGDVPNAPSMQEAGWALEFCSDKKNVAEAFHEKEIAKAAVNHPSVETSSDQGHALDRTSRAATRNMMVHIHTAQQHALVRTSDAIDQHMQQFSSDLGLHVARLPDGQLSVHPNFLENPSGVAQLLELAEVSYTCRTLSQFYEPLGSEPGSEVQYEANGIHGDHLPLFTGSFFSTLRSRGDGYAEWMQVVSQCRTAYLPHYETFMHADSLVQDHNGFASAGPQDQELIRNTFYALGNYAVETYYCAAVKEALGISDTGYGVRPGEEVDAGDEYLVTFFNQLESVASKLGALDPSSLSILERQTRDAVIDATADIQSRLADWRESPPTLLSTLFENVKDFQPVRTSAPDGHLTRLQRNIQSILGQTSPFLVPLPNTPREPEMAPDRIRF